MNGELLMALEGTGKEVLSNIITDANGKGEIPEDFEKCVIVRIPKKKNRQM